MASRTTPARLSTLLAGRHAPGCLGRRRGFHVSARERAAQNFNMPALSPTMLQGNIASWTKKEGESYSAGDVLLEIETDKATMDVEAQDDGILFKIMQGDGAKDVKVGERIAVMAEEGDDLGSLEVPADDKGASAGQQAKTEEPPKQEEKKSATPPAPSKPAAESSPAPSTPQGGRAQKQTYPLYPAVQHLLHENGLSAADADKIPASGPSGRLLKGDVLAYLGRISKDYPAQSSARLNKLTHLDLSNIQRMPPKPAQAGPATQPAAPQMQPVEEDQLFSAPISLSAVLATQKRVQDSLGIFLPLSTFIARASELANEDLPASRNRKPSAEDLFNAIVGLDAVSSHSSSRGHFIPQVSAALPVIAPPTTRTPREADIIDVLAAKPRTSSKPIAPPTKSPAALGISAGSDNLFSVTAKTGEESRAVEYLARMKLALEKEPGRLIL